MNANSTCNSRFTQRLLRPADILQCITIYKASYHVIVVIIIMICTKNLTRWLLVNQFAEAH